MYHEYHGTTAIQPNPTNPDCGTTKARLLADTATPRTDVETADIMSRGGKLCVLVFAVNILPV
jgi:hypothetical protein